MRLASGRCCVALAVRGAGPGRRRPAGLAVAAPTCGDAAFDAPSPNWNRGHRGVDLAGAPVSRFTPPRPGTVVFAGELAGRRWCRSPTRAGCAPATSRSGGGAGGSAGRAGAVIGELVAGHPGCAARVPALGCDVGPRRARRLRRSPWPARDDAHPAQATTRPS